MTSKNESYNGIEYVESLYYSASEIKDHSRIHRNFGDIIDCMFKLEDYSHLTGNPSKRFYAKIDIDIDNPNIYMPYHKSYIIFITEFSKDIYDLCKMLLDKMLSDISKQLVEDIDQSDIEHIKERAFKILKQHLHIP